jgi:cyclophilin family peptidyl-prolyl cis-trans isomerase
VVVGVAGERGVGKYGAHLQYAQSRFHRAMPDFMVQGGDIVKGDGSSGESVFAGNQVGTG